MKWESAILMVFVMSLLTACDIGIAAKPMLQPEVQVAATSTTDPNDSLDEKEELDQATAQLKAIFMDIAQENAWQLSQKICFYGEDEGRHLKDHLQFHQTHEKRKVDRYFDAIKQTLPTTNADNLPVNILKHERLVQDEVHRIRVYYNFSTTPSTADHLVEAHYMDFLASSSGPLLLDLDDRGLYKH